jgi:hypothetical protein
MSIIEGHGSLEGNPSSREVAFLHLDLPECSPTLSTLRSIPHRAIEECVRATPGTGP